MATGHVAADEDADHESDDGVGQEGVVGEEAAEVAAAEDAERRREEGKAAGEQSVQDHLNRWFVHLFQVTG